MIINLTPTQMRVLRALCETGGTNTDVASSLGLSPKNVEERVRELREHAAGIVENPNGDRRNWLLRLAHWLGVRDALAAVAATKREAA